MLEQIIMPHVIARTTIAAGTLGKGDEGFWIVMLARTIG
jgi:hypothetical protein